MNLGHVILVALISAFTLSGFANCEIMGIFDEIAALEIQIASIENGSGNPILLPLMKRKLHSLKSSLNESEKVAVRETIRDHQIEVKAQKQAEQIARSEEKVALAPPPPPNFHLEGKFLNMHQKITARAEDLSFLITFKENNLGGFKIYKHDMKDISEIPVGKIPEGKSIHQARVSPDGTKVAVQVAVRTFMLAEKSVLYIFDLVQGKTIAKYELQAKFSSFHFTSDSKNLLLIPRESTSLYRWNFSSPQNTSNKADIELSRLPGNGQSYFSPHQRSGRLVLYDTQGKVWIVDENTLQPILEVDVPLGVHPVTLSVDGRFLALHNRDKKELQIFEIDSRTVFSISENQVDPTWNWSGIYKMDLSKDGSFLAFYSHDKNSNRIARVVSLREGRPVLASTFKDSEDTWFSSSSNAYLIRDFHEEYFKFEEVP